MKCIITTTIQAPTEAIRRFDAMDGWTLIVAGDTKTPKDYRLERGIYLSPQEQDARYPDISTAIGWNNHGRRNIGNLVALEMGADVVAIVDDDNIPLDGWGQDLLVGQSVRVNYYETTEPAFEPIGATNYPHLWHRGFPVELVSSRSYANRKEVVMVPDIQADFWNGDPDIDAIARMLYHDNCKFDRSVFPMASNAPAPFNSQNTFMTAKALRDYFVLPHLTPRGRMGDIWMAYHMAAEGYKVVFGAPSVRQDRNEHNLADDLADEMLGIRHNLTLVKAIAMGTYSPFLCWDNRTIQCYRKYMELTHK